MKPHRGTLILVFGILSLVFCPPFGIAAWVMGNNDLREIGQGIMDPMGRDTTNAGRICGIIGSILMMIQIMAIVVMLVFYGAILAAAIASDSVQSSPQPAVEGVISR